MKLSDEGLALIKRFEGLRISAYQCSASVWTIGYGSTKGVQKGDTITPEEAVVRLKADVEDAEKTVLRHVRVPITQAQFDALVSFVFNVGPTHFAESRLLAKLNMARYELASREFPKWITAAGKVLPGLVTRRQAEMSLFRRDLPKHTPEAA